MDRKPTTLRINDIAIPERGRSEARNVASLAKSIEARGLLHPPVVRRDGERWVLVAGLRRLAALRALRHTETPVTVAESITDELSALYAEGEENTEREAYTPEEAARHAEIIGKVEHEAAKNRQKASGPASVAKREGRIPAHGSGNFPEPSPRHERESRTRTARAVGYSAPTLAKAREVIETRDNPDAPEPVRQAARQAAEEMNRSGKVDPAFRKVETAKAVETARPLMEFLDADEGARIIEFRAAFAKAISRAGDITTFDAERVAADLDDDGMGALRRLGKQITRYVERVEAARPSGLRLVSGGKS